MTRKTLLFILFSITALLICAIVWIGVIPEAAPAETALYTEHTSDPTPSFSPSSVPAGTAMPDVSPSSTPPPGPTGAVVEDSEAVAMLYRDLVLDSEGNSGIAVSLRNSDYAAILALLAEEGLIAFDSARKEPMTNPQAVYDFFDTLKADSASAGTLSLFELCPDGGFLRHDLQAGGGAWRLTLTRLTWTWEEPVVTYSNTYTLTHLALTEGGCIVYDYAFPDNPAGGNHDGHVDTVTRIPLVPQRND